LIGSLVFTNNSAGLQGGAIFIQDLLIDNLFIAQMIISENSAYQGGGIAILLPAAANNISVYLKEVTFINNKAVY
jgi:predicted outer membrane repeat protein